MTMFRENVIAIDASTKFFNTKSAKSFFCVLVLYGLFRESNNVNRILNKNNEIEPVKTTSASAFLASATSCPNARARTV